MPNLLHISASIQGDTSVSRSLSTALAHALGKKSGGDIIERDLSANDLPLIDGARFAANGTAPEDRTDAQSELAAIADTLISELQQADTIVLGVPIYNFGAPASLKVWADLVARAGTTFKYTPEGPVGLLTGKKAYITVASGGTRVDSDTDFMTPWLRHFLGFIGITDVEVIEASALMAGDADEKVSAAKARIEALVS